MRYRNDDQPASGRRGAGTASGQTLKRRLFNGIVVIAVSALVASCGSSSNIKTSKKRSKEYFPEKKYGVNASPRVADAGKPVRKGGGRYMVGKPYKVAGKWYRPRVNTKYNKTGRASWYGSAFHGRLTANGEVYDMNALSAAHPTLPLPSYVRVTNLKNRRSVIVRVNDRGPFHGGRVIDLSKRTADLLDFSGSGVAKVRVKYVGRAPLHGRDHAKLMASYRGPGQAAPGGTMPGTMFAQAEPLSSAPVPKSRPYNVAPAPVMTAFDPAAYTEGAAVMLAAAGAVPQGEDLPELPRNTTSATGTYDPEPADSTPVTPSARAKPDARKVRTFSFKLNGDDPTATPEPIDNADDVKTVKTVAISGPRPVEVEPAPGAAKPVRLVYPSRTAARAAPVAATNAGNGPVPPAGIGGPFVPVSNAQTTTVSAGGLFYAGKGRIDGGHAMIAAMANDAVPLAALNARIAEGRRVIIMLGRFSDTANARRLERKLSGLGRVERKSVLVKGRRLTQLSLTELRPHVSIDRALQTAERAGAHGAYRMN